MISVEKKRVSFVILIKLILVLLTCCIALLVVMVQTKSLHATVVEKNAVQAVRVRQQGAEINPQQNNQSFVGRSNSGNNANIVGHDQGNTGNEGANQGYSQDNSINAGNSVSGQRKNIQYQRNDQDYEGTGGGDGGSTTFVGTNQGNSGNEGFNAGFNQDNANNAGNQVNNQGDVIGTQINNQGSTVNNDGSLIENQTNYINLLPPVQANLHLGPGPRLAVGVSGG